MITCTEAAAKHIGEYLKKRGKGIGIRFGVRPSKDCLGMTYKLEYVDRLNDDDLVFESFGIKIVSDPKSLVYIDGTELDFIKQGLQTGFKFNNPLEKERCGCGKSFQV